MFFFIWMLFWCTLYPGGQTSQSISENRTYLQHSTYHHTEQFSLIRQKHFNFFSGFREVWVFQMYLSHVITFITVSILDIFVCVIQYWNRLSSLQRSIICMMVIFGTLSGVYIIPTIYEDYASLEHAARNRNEASFHDSGVLPTNIDDIVKNSINYVYNKAKQLKANSSVVSFVVFFFSFCIWWGYLEKLLYTLWHFYAEYKE